MNDKYDKDYDDKDYVDHPVRDYVLTGGRTGPGRNTIRPETLLVVADPAKPPPFSASSEVLALLRMCKRLLSLVEAAAHLNRPVNVVAVLASDLVDSGHLKTRLGPTKATQHAPELLQEVLNGLLNL